MKLIHCGPVAAAKGGLPGAVMGKRGNRTNRNEMREERETETGGGETEEERQTDRQGQRLYFAF